MTMEKNLMEEMLQENENLLSVPKRGDIIKGKVIQVLENEVVVNIGYKSDGVIPVTEITNNAPADTNTVDSWLEVTVNGATKYIPLYS